MAAQRGLLAARRRRRQLNAPNVRQDPGQGDRARGGGDAEYRELQSHPRTVDDHSTESMCGIKKIEALGALKLLSGGYASLAAVDDLHQATGRDSNPVVGQKHNATVVCDIDERIQGMRRSVAAVSQRLQAPKT